MAAPNESIQVEVIKYMLMAEDMPRATAFYRDALGLEARFESSHWTELAFGDAVVALHAGGTGEPTKTGLSIQVRDLASACEAVEAAGGRVVEAPRSRPNEPIRLARLRDTEGNEFTMTQYVGN